MSTHPAAADRFVTLAASRYNLIVVIMQGQRSKHDRSWHCPTESEADELVNWLRANSVRAIAVGDHEWNELPERCE
jgi:hypothetical protein